MKRIAIISIYALTIGIVLFQATRGERYPNVYKPMLWLLFNVLPLFYLRLGVPAGKAYETRLLVFAASLLLSLLLHPFFLNAYALGAERYLLLSLSWLAPLQLILAWPLLRRPFTAHCNNAPRAEAIAAIREHVQHNELEVALEQLGTLPQLTKNDKKVVHTLTYRLADAERKNVLGILPNDALTVEKNQIVNGLLSFLDLLEGKGG